MRAPAEAEPPQPAASGLAPVVRGGGHMSESKDFMKTISGETLSRFDKDGHPRTTCRTGSGTFDVCCSALESLEINRRLDQSAHFTAFTRLNFQVRAAIHAGNVDLVGELFDAVQDLSSAALAAAEQAIRAVVKDDPEESTQTDAARKQ